MLLISCFVEDINDYDFLTLLRAVSSALAYGSAL